MPNAVIAGYARSPFHLAGKGDLARVRPDDLAAQVIRGLIDRTGVKAEDVEDIILGCAFPEGEQGLNVARLIGLLADLPLKVGGMTVNRFCGSSMSSVHIAAGQIAIGAGEVFGGGVAPAIAGQIAASSGIQHVFTFTIASLIVGFVVALFLRETAPRKAAVA